VILGGWYGWIGPQNLGRKPVAGDGSAGPWTVATNVILTGLRGGVLGTRSKSSLEGYRFGDENQRFSSVNDTEIPVTCFVTRFSWHLDTIYKTLLLLPKYNQDRKKNHTTMQIIVTFLSTTFVPYGNSKTYWWIRFCTDWLNMKVNSSGGFCGSNKRFNANIYSKIILVCIIRNSYPRTQPFESS
jgi:hypothetical protein